MSTMMEEEFKRWTAKRKAQLVLDVEQYEKQIRELQEAYGEAMLQMRVLKKYQNPLGDDDI